MTGLGSLDYTYIRPVNNFENIVKGLAMRVQESILMQLYQWKPVTKELELPKEVTI